jgi:hypothetical protein
MYSHNRLINKYKEFLLDEVKHLHTTILHTHRHIQARALPPELRKNPRYNLKQATHIIMKHNFETGQSTSTQLNISCEKRMG